METFIKYNILSRFANLIGTPRLVKKTNQNLINIFYHAVSDSYLPHISPLYKLKSVGDFTNDIDFILKHFQPVSIDEVLEKTKQNRTFEKQSVHISFDDGLKEVYSNVLPILKSKGIPATIFVNSDFVDNKNLLYRYKVAIIVDTLKKTKIDSNTKREVLKIINKQGLESNNINDKLFNINYNQKSVLDDIANFLDISYKDYLSNKKPYLTISQLKEMQNAGFTIGSHSVDHPNYANISPKNQITQTLQSTKFVKDTFKQNHSYFAFPFSDFGVNKDTFNAIYKTVDLSFGISGIGTKHDGLHQQRIDMEKCRLSAKSAINRAYLVKYLKSKK